MVQTQPPVFDIRPYSPCDTGIWLPKLFETRYPNEKESATSWILKEVLTQFSMELSKFKLTERGVAWCFHPNLLPTLGLLVAEAAGSLTSIFSESGP